MGLIDELESSYELDLVEEFVEHLGFMCGGLEMLILGLEKEELYSSNIQELFRIFHNIKSASSYFKLDPISKLSQLVEDVLEEARIQKGIATHEFIDWLFIISDQFTKWKNNLERNSEALDTYIPKIIKIPKELVIHEQI